MMLPEEKKLRVLLRRVLYHDLQVKKTTWVHLDKPFAIVEFTTGLAEIFCCSHWYQQIWHGDHAFGKLDVFDLGGEDWVAFIQPRDTRIVNVYEFDAWEILFRGITMSKPTSSYSLSM
jgi:hypothetical protein